MNFGARFPRTTLLGNSLRRESFSANVRQLPAFLRWYVVCGDYVCAGGGCTCNLWNRKRQLSGDSSKYGIQQRWRQCFEERFEAQDEGSVHSWMLGVDRADNEVRDFLNSCSAAMPISPED